MLPGDNKFGKLINSVPEPKEEKTNSKDNKESLQVQFEEKNYLLERVEEKNLSPEQVAVLENFFRKSKYGHQFSLVLKCRGTQCAILGMCPLYKAQMKLPVGEDCPVEHALIQQWVDKILSSLDIDPANPEYAVDMDMVYELAGLELLRMRAAHDLSVKGTLSETKIVGYSPQGHPIQDEKPHMALLVIEKYSKSIAKLREQLLATRKSQAQAGKITGDSSTRAAKIAENARRIIEKRSKGQQIEDADYEIKEDE